MSAYYVSSNILENYRETKINSLQILRFFCRSSVKNAIGKLIGIALSL